MIMRKVQHRLRTEEFRGAKLIGRSLIDLSHKLASNGEPPYDWRMSTFSHRYLKTLQILDLMEENVYDVHNKLDETFSRVRIYLQKVRASRRKPRGQRR